jgi:Fe-S cluster assembly protein SufD
LPTPDEEVWRYSRVAEIDLDTFQPVGAGDGAGGAAVPAEATPVVSAVGAHAALLVVRDGRLVHAEIDESLAARGLYAGPLEAMPDGADRFRAVAGETVDVFDRMSDAFAPEPLVVRAPPGLVLTAPVVVVNVTTAAEGAVFPRLLVEAGEDTELTVVNHDVSADVHALVVPVVEIDAGPASRVRYVNGQQLGYGVWQIGRLVSRVERDANLQTANIALGGDYARLRIDSTMLGRGGSGEMLAVYFGEGSQMHDFRTLQDHAAPATTSDLLFKGVVQGTSRSVYTGLIRIEKDAAGVNAFQTNRNIKLSPGAWAESVPNLEIENNDVRCSHASTVGPIDETQRFYLESRGVPPPIAERLVVLGFFEEVLAKLPSRGLAALFRAEIRRKLERRLL